MGGVGGWGDGCGEECGCSGVVGDERGKGEGVGVGRSGGRGAVVRWEVGRRVHDCKGPRNRGGMSR